MKKEIVKFLKNDGIGVLPTDTLYGIVGSAFSKKTVLRIYKVRLRNKKKPLIILISKISDIKKFGVKNIPEKSLSKIWPGKVSVILECKSSKFKYLHRDTNALCFRIPDNKSLRDLISKTGAIVAPSANTEGKPSAKNIAEARKYFEEKADFYISGKVTNKGSTILRYSSKEKVFELVRIGTVSKSRLRQKILIK